MRISDWSSDVCSSDLFAALKGVGGSFLALVLAFLAPKVVGPFLLMVAYTVLCAWLLSLVQLWTWANLKTTILWIGAFAFVAMFNAAQRRPKIGRAHV